MAENDAIERATIARINGLFGSVTSGANTAATALRGIHTASKGVVSGLGGLSASMDYSGASISKAAIAHMDAAKSAQKSWRSAGAHAGGVLANAADDAVGAAGRMLGKGADDASKGLGAAFSGLGRKAGGFGGMMSGLMKGGTKLGIGFTVLRGIVGVGATAIGALVTFSSDLFKGWQGLSRVGINLGGDFSRLGVAAKETRLSTQQLGQHLTANSQALALFGGIAGQGAEQLINLQKNMQDASFGYRGSSTSFALAMEQIGIKSDESMGLIGEMIGDQVFAAAMRKRSDQDQTEVTADYITQLDQLSKLTGKSREQLATERKKASQDAQFMAAMEGKSAKEIQAMNDAMQKVQELGGPAAVEVFKARLAGVVPAGKEARMLMSTPMGRAAEAMASEMRNASGVDAIKGISGAYMDTMQGASKETKEMMRPFALAGPLVGKFFANTYEMSVTTTNRIEGIMDAIGASFTGPGGLQSSTMKLSDAFLILYDRTTGTVRDAEGVVTGVGTEGTNAMININRTLSDAMFALTGAISGLVGSGTAAGALNAVSSGVSGLSTGLFNTEIGFGAGHDRRNPFSPNFAPGGAVGSEEKVAEQRANRLSVENVANYLMNSQLGSLVGQGYTATMSLLEKSFGPGSKKQAEEAIQKAQLKRLEELSGGKNQKEKAANARLAIKEGGGLHEALSQAVQQELGNKQTVQDKEREQQTLGGILQKWFTKDPSKSITQEINDHNTMQTDRIVEAMLYPKLSHDKTQRGSTTQQDDSGAPVSWT